MKINSYILFLVKFEFDVVGFSMNANVLWMRVDVATTEALST